jgi:hypothetical protein
MEKNRKLSFEVSFEQPPTAEIAMAGFLFYCNGRFLQQQLVQKNRLEFNLADGNTKAAESAREISTGELRLLIAPVTDKNIFKVTSIEGLEKYKAYEPVIKKNADGLLSILPIPGNISVFWPRCYCRVTGKVSKWFQTGGSWENRAVCRAKVHICDVDAIRYWIYKIPDRIIAKIPAAFLNPKELVRHPIPIPDPPPFTLNRFSMAKQPAIFKKITAENKIMDQAAALPELSLEIRQSFASQNLDRIRETIINNYVILHPWFCLWPWWWPYFYRLQELAVDYTDANGRFDVNVSYHCFRDKPDIYIWVEYLINGSWEIIYHPPIPCNIRWNYACATPINIQVTDPRVPGNCCCNCSLPGDLVWIRTVSLSTSVSHIKQTSEVLPPPGQSTGYDRIGLTDAPAAGDPSYLPTAVNDYKRPFGGKPSLYMGFGSSLPNNSIYHYRWSYKQIKDADLNDVSDSFKPLEPIGGTVNKGYQFEYTDSNGDIQSAPNSVKLGPFTVGPNDNLYIIPPERPNMAPFNAPETSPDWHEQTDNMFTMHFDSATLKNGALPGGDGLYEFKLELFDQAGNLLSNVPKSTFKVPDFDNAGFSVNAPDALLINTSATTASAFKVLMRFDNGQCQGEIFTVEVNGAPASLDCCGFAKYKPGGVEADLSLSFEATHPNNFAVFSFGVVRGTCDEVLSSANANGMVIDDAMGYVLTSGVYEKHLTPAALLGECYLNGTGKAAFAQNLYVTAMATDGHSRQSNKDAGDVAAFALEP